MREQALAFRRPVQPEVHPTPARRVLIVDDDPEILARVAEVLRFDPTHFEPVGVESAQAALRILAGDEGIDCLLAEAALPGTDGLQLLLQARELRPALKVVVMTSAPTPDLMRAVLESGAARLLSKPLDFDGILPGPAGGRPPRFAAPKGRQYKLLADSLACRLLIDSQGMESLSKPDNRHFGDYPIITGHVADMPKSMRMTQSGNHLAPAMLHHTTGPYS